MGCANSKNPPDADADEPSIEVQVALGRTGGANEKEFDGLARTIRNSIIGGDTVIWTPFGKRRLIYSDYTASGRALSFVEDYMRSAVLPLYANTHTEASATGLQTTVLREEARTIVARSVNAPPDEYVTLLVGTGSTGAIDKLGRVLGLSLPAYAASKLGKSKDDIPESQRPVVFHGPFEHHSNELWWRESIATVVAIGEDRSGRPDMEQLARELENHAHRPLKIGTFSAGSNVTGIRADTVALAELLHANGALACFDYAGVGAYVPINMIPTPTAEGKDASMDAIFLSPHKFVGGPGSSGVLVARRSLFTNEVPTCPGGGTVAYVGPHAHEYDASIEAREDGGTPGIIQAIRCGLAFQLKERVGPHAIECAEQELGMKAIEAWRAHPSILLMGADRPGFFEYKNRVSIISFNVLAPAMDSTGSGAPTGYSMPKICGGRLLLHPHFVIQLLNDVYGIQARSGCSCTGPYGHRLWGWDDPWVACLRSSIAGGEHAGKMGWARVNFNYFIGQEEADYVRHAVLQIAEHGWRLLPFYTMDPCSGQFAHRTFQRLYLLRSLAELDLQPGSCTFRVPCQDSSPMNHADELRRAGAIYQLASAVVKTKPKGVMCREHDYSTRASVELLDFEWWLTPSKAMELMQQENAVVAEMSFGAMGGLSPSEDKQLRNMLESTGFMTTFDELEPTSSIHN